MIPVFSGSGPSQSTLRIRLLWLLALGLASLTPVARSKTVPDWVQPLLGADVAELGLGQSAVNLGDLENVRYLQKDRVHRLRRGAVKILADSGRVHASCEYAYNADVERIRHAQAWIISKDGKKSTAIPLREFADRAAQMGAFFWPQQRLLTFSAGDRVESGGVLAWEFEVESQSGISDINWSFSGHLATVVSTLEVAPPPEGRLAWNAAGESVPAPAPGSLPGALRWERHRIAAPTGDRPDGFFPTPNLVSVRAVNTGDTRTWSSFARLAADVIEPRIVITPEVKAKAQTIIAGKADRWDRIRALTEFVQREITYLAITWDRDYLAGYRPHPAAEVLQNRHGDCKDKSALLVALLRAIGEDGRVVLVYAGNPKGVRPDWPSACFNHAIVGISSDNIAPAHWPTVPDGTTARLVLFDPTDPHSPLGVLPPSCRGGFGLVASTDATGLISLPAGKAIQNHYDSRTLASLDRDGTLTAGVVETALGETGVAFHVLRERLRAEKFAQSLEARLRENVALVNNLKWADTWVQSTAQWRLDFEFTAQRYARKTAGNLMLVSPLLPSARSQLAPWKTNQEGVVWLGAGSARKEMRLELPAETVIEELPEDWNGQTDSISCHLRYRLEAQAVVCEAVFAQEAKFLDRLSYEKVRALVQKLQEAERRPIVLRLKPAQ